MKDSVTILYHFALKFYPITDKFFTIHWRICHMTSIFELKIILQSTIVCSFHNCRCYIFHCEEILWFLYTTLVCTLILIDWTFAKTALNSDRIWVLKRILPHESIATFFPSHPLFWKWCCIFHKISLSRISCGQLHRFPITRTIG